MLYDRLPQFRCAQCDKEDKKINGCIHPYHKPVWYTDECFYCEGQNIECSMCQGRNEIPVYSCPQVLFKSAVSFLPYYNDWHKSEGKIWPYGGYRSQYPVKLGQAFNFLNNLCTKYKSDIDDQRLTDGKSCPPI